MNNYLVDTTLIIELLRGNTLAKQFLERNTINISIVTTAELIQGAKNKEELDALSRLCKDLSEVLIDKKISQKAISLLKTFHLPHGLFFLDALIAATAIEYSKTLVTGNVKDFSYIPKLKILPQTEALQTI